MGLTQTTLGRQNGKLLIGELKDYLHKQINNVLKQQEQDYAKVYEKAYEEYDMNQVREIYKKDVVNNKHYDKNKHNSPEIEDNGLGL